MIAVLIGAAAVAFIAISVLLCRPRRTQSSQRFNTQANASTDAQSPHSNAPEAPVPEPQSPQSTNHQQWTAEQRKDCRECVTVCIEGAALLGLSIYACFTYGLWTEAHKQTVDSARAWIGYQQIPNSNSPVAIDRLEISPKLDVEWHDTIENFGNGPAIKVISQGWVATEGGLRDIAGYAAFICDAATKFATGTVAIEPPAQNPGRMGFVLFPHQTYTDDSFSPSRSGSPLASAWSGAAQPNLKGMFIMGCVAYLDQFRTPHWTRFVVQIGNGKDPVSIASPQQLYSLFNDTDETDEGNRRH